ncbi:MAG: helix-turn-helix transcriptional regulator [Actinomycetota bacterium]
MGLSNVMKGRRHALGMSQRRLADLAGVTVRQIARYESDEQQPALNVAVAIAAALDISVAELAGEYSSQPDLSGRWSLTWERRSEGGTSITTDPLQLIQHGRTVRLSSDGADGHGVSWRGELRLTGHTALAGWYAAEDSRRNGGGLTTGTLLLIMADDETTGHGRWVSAEHDGRAATGRAGIARGTVAGQEVMARAFGRSLRTD